MIISLSENCSYRHHRRFRRNGNEYDFVFEEFINGKPAPFGLLFKSKKTGKYCWYSREYINMPFYDGEKISNITEGVDTYTDDKLKVAEYFEHLMNKKLSKRDKKRFAPLYERAVNQQQSVVDILQNL